MSDIDPKEFGRLIGIVESMQSQLSHMATEVDNLSNQMNRGKGVMFGLLLAAGGIGASATHVIEKMFK